MVELICWLELSSRLILYLAIHAAVLEQRIAAKYLGRH